MFQPTPSSFSQKYAVNPWEEGFLALSDAHFGDLKNGCEEAVVNLIYDATRYALANNIGMIFNGDTFDHYPYSSQEDRLQDSGVLRDSLPALAKERLPIAFLEGNHDPDLTHADIRKYTGLSSDQFTLAHDFYMPNSEILVTHGHKVELFNLSKLTKRFHAQLSSVFGEQWSAHPPSEELQHAILQLLTDDEELQKESDKVDRYYQNGIDHPNNRWITRRLHSLVMLFQSSRGYSSVQLEKLSQSCKNPRIQDILRKLASMCRLHLAHRALRFVKPLHIPIIVCGHNHVPQIDALDCDDEGDAAHIYANCGSAYQRGQSNTMVHIQRDDIYTRVKLLSHIGPGQFSLLDQAQYKKDDQ